MFRGAAGGHYGDAITLTEIAQGCVRRFSDSLDRGARFGRDIEEQHDIERFLLAAEVKDGLRFPIIGDSEAFLSETRDSLPVLSNLGIHMDQRNVAVERRLILCEEQKK